MIMAGLLRGAQIEKILNEGLLALNYARLTPDSGPCIDLIVEYVGITDSVSDRSVLFVNGLSKVASHISESTDRLNGLQAKLYQFNIEGVGIIRRGITRLSQNNLISLESHFFSYAADAARAVFESTKDVSWAIKWYDARKKSADMARKIEPKHSAHSYGFAGDAARAVFEATRNVSWAMRWYNAKRKSADMTRETDPKHSAYSYGFAGDAAKTVYYILHSRTWAKKAIKCYKNFIDYYENNPTPEMQSLVDAIRRDVAYIRYNLRTKKV